MGPLSLTPRALWRPRHRFDDPEEEFRTLYCAEHARTGLRETLQDFRPDTKALAGLAALGGDRSVIPESVVPLAWRERHVLVKGRCEVQGALVDLAEIPVRRSLELRHAKLLAALGVRHLDVSDVTSKIRPMTQAIARSLYAEGLDGVEDPVAGIVYRSNLDHLRCYALFEDRYEIQPLDGGKPLAEPFAELLEVCGELGLQLGGP